MEVNPNHPVTAAVHDHWHKIVALLMHKFELGHVVITGQDLAAFEREYPNHAIMIHDKRDGIHLRMVSMEEADRLAREHGGLPV